MQKIDKLMNERDEEEKEESSQCDNHKHFP